MLDILQWESKSRLFLHEAHFPVYYLFIFFEKFVLTAAAQVRFPVSEPSPANGRVARASADLKPGKWGGLCQEGHLA